VTRRLVVLVAVAVVGVVAFAACGSGVGSHSLDDTASRWLQSEVAAARSAAASGNNSAAVSELQRVVTDAQALHARHEIGDARASEIQLAAQKVIFAIATSNTTTTTAAQPPAPPDPRPAHDKKGKRGD
jgi:hypothetical protein